MEKELFSMNGSNNTMPSSAAWNLSSFGMEIQSNELNPNCFFSPNWENSMDQGDPFESALSSIVSSPAASTAAGIPGSGAGESIVLRELIGRLGSICNSGENSPHSYVNGNGNNSTNTSCYSTPLNSPPKHSLSMMDHNHQIRGFLPIPGNQFPPNSNLGPISSDPGFAERAARFSCFGARNPQIGALNPQFGINEPELSQRLPSRIDSSKSPRILSNQNLKVASGSPLDGGGPLLDGISGSDKKFSRLSRSSTPENGEFVESREESSVSEQTPGGEIGIRAQNEANARKRKAIPRGKAKEIPSSSTAAKDAKVAGEKEESNAKKSKSDEENAKTKESAEEKKQQSKESAKAPEPPKDYIHVRARRGQATDSHSLAERVRREKISERMKFLQDLVPGCNKVTGKAVMLDEIINYVQSLQRQVEFLSMKLSTVNPRMDFNMEALLSKDIFQSRGSVNHNSIYPLENSAALGYGYQSQQLPMLSSGISSATEAPFLMNNLNAALRRNSGIQMPHIDGFGEAPPSQGSTFLEDDLHCVVQMGFGQNQPQSFPGTTQMKVEL